MLLKTGVEKNFAAEDEFKKEPNGFWHFWDNGFNEINLNLFFSSPDSRAEILRQYIFNEFLNDIVIFYFYGQHRIVLSIVKNFIKSIS